MDKKLLEKLQKIRKDDPLLITVTTLLDKKRSKNKVDAFFILNKFPYQELKTAKKLIIELIDKEMKKNR